MSGGSRILLIRIGAIGNALVAVPAIRALRQARPEAYLCLVADPLTLELLKGCPYLDDTVRYDNHGPEKAGPGYLRFIVDLRRRRFTHAIHFRRYLRSELMGWLAGPPERIGFKTESPLQLLTEKVDYVEGESVIEQNLKLVRALGIDARDRTLELWPPEHSDAVDRLLAGLIGRGPLTVIHPAGSTQKERLWPGFGELGRKLYERLDARVVMIGAESERELVEAAAAAAGAAVAVGLKLPEAAQLIQRADLFAGTDSGPAHVADAVHTPGVIVYAPHEGLDRQIAKWKPEGDSYLAFTPPRDCAECEERPCSLDRQKQCAAAISVDEVVEGLIELDRRSGGEAARRARR